MDGRTDGRTHNFVTSSLLHHHTTTITSILHFSSHIPHTLGQAGSMRSVFFSTISTRARPGKANGRARQHPSSIRHQSIPSMQLASGGAKTPGLISPHRLVSYHLFLRLSASCVLRLRFAFLRLRLLHHFFKYPLGTDGYCSRLLHDDQPPTDAPRQPALSSSSAPTLFVFVFFFFCIAFTLPFILAFHHFTTTQFPSFQRFYPSFTLFIHGFINLHLLHIYPLGHHIGSVRFGTDYLGFGFRVRQSERASERSVYHISCHLSSLCFFFFFALLAYV
ncbi:uncharacterized protein K452DRAFT_59298 [Aplosporella prunicola CBS 121167]|uniref:Uncharacterized protein n=1 Tax=Aplosporella prunicola CBS 121167 TaxID=1176127 RepID=A0A6A6B7B1_9PEZI|nr:uncharacterized protein K452DRAFT_59298 [Aplosporella prunicola CBS 121167]KAF2140009.1 hypothetical protein K452DRAFT_59298 [Aplosporella prunicola CBS 121167]